ncbi:MAG: urease accessory protein UreG, partial [Ilumatobacteraceae bacterium]
MPPDHNPGQPHHPGDGHTHGHHDGLPDDAMWAYGAPGTRPLRVGIGGPVGSGKTALVAALCR